MDRPHSPIRRRVLLAALPLSLAMSGAARAAGAGEGAGYQLVTGTFSDPAKQKAYMASLPPIYRRHGGRYVAFGGGATVTVLDGAWTPRGVVLAVFDSPAAVDGFWNSPEYRAAVAIRDGGGSFDVANVPGRAAPGAPPSGSPVDSRRGYMIHLAPAGTDLAPLDRAVLRGGGRLLASTPAARPLEGRPAAAVLVAEFASMASVTAFWAGWRGASERSTGDAVTLALAEIAPSPPAR